jgi:8-oxo-dGTP pyrophosphatase MutT (NUDIX family)
MAKKAQRLRPEADREPRSQVAALPWRPLPDGGVEVLLITSRETKRWVIPKGWPIRGLSSCDTAAREAFEEAGVAGRIAKKPKGAYHYDKRLRSGRIQHVRVAVFTLRVVQESETWPEVGQREKRWTAPADAANLVDEPELKTLLSQFTG